MVDQRFRAILAALILKEGGRGLAHPGYATLPARHHLSEATGADGHIILFSQCPAGLQHAGGKREVSPQRLIIAPFFQLCGV